MLQIGMPGKPVFFFQNNAHYLVISDGAKNPFYLQKAERE